MFIGVMGAKGSGKDTVADILVQDHGYIKVAFADPLREMAEAIDPVVAWDLGGDPDGAIHYSDALKWYGYRRAKEMYPELRRFLQRLGTEAGREVVHPDFWTDMFREKVMELGHDKIVASDCRFQNEVDLIRQMNGRVWTVLRPGIDPEDEHASEAYWRTIIPDEEIFNDDTLAELREGVAAYVEMPVS